MSTITVKDSTTIYYKDWGAGPVVTFSHGWPLSSDMWDGQMLFLASSADAWHTIVAATGDPARPGPGTTWTGMPTIWRRDRGSGSHGHHDGRPLDRRRRSRALHWTARYERVVRAVLIAAVPPIMLKSASNPEGLPIGSSTTKSAVVKDRAQAYKDFASAFYGANRPGAQVSQGARSVLALEHAGRSQELLRQHQGLF